MEVVLLQEFGAAEGKNIAMDIPCLQLALQAIGSLFSLTESARGCDACEGAVATKLEASERQDLIG